MSTMIEAAAIPDIFVSGVGRVETLAPNLFRVSYYAAQRNAYDGSPEQVLVAKFIVTFETLLAMSAATLEKRGACDEAIGLARPVLVN